MEVLILDGKYSYFKIFIELLLTMSVEIYEKIDEQYAHMNKASSLHDDGVGSKEEQNNDK